MKEVSLIYDFKNEIAKCGLTIDEYEQVLKECSDKQNRILDCEWADIISKYNIKNPNGRDSSMHYDTLRKAQQTIFGGAFVSEYYKWKETQNKNIDDDEYLNKIRLEKQEIQKEKRKLFDERLDINKRLREESRLETTIEKFEDMLSNIGTERYVSYSPIVSGSDNDMIVCLSDLHIGASFYNFDGCYDSYIAKDRLNKYLAEVIDIQKTHKAENCVVMLLGDLVSGNIHKTISVTNKENVIEQVKLTCEYISDFVYELGKYFKTVELKGVSGNHSRIDEKEDALLGERLDTLIIWFIKTMLKNVSNIVVEDENIDDTLSKFFLRDKLYYGVHGDFDATNMSSMAKLILWSKNTPYCVLCGHKHYPAMSDISGIKVVQSGSLCGSGDEYTRQKRLTGEPSQTVLVVNENGIKCHYPIVLN